MGTRRAMLEENAPWAASGASSSCPKCGAGMLRLDIDCLPCPNPRCAGDDRPAYGVRIVLPFSPHDEISLTLDVETRHYLRGIVVYMPSRKRVFYWDEVTSNA